MRKCLGFMPSLIPVIESLWKKESGVLFSSDRWLLSDLDLAGVRFQIVKIDRCSMCNFNDLCLLIKSHAHVCIAFRTELVHQILRLFFIYIKKKKHSVINTFSLTS